MRDLTMNKYTKMFSGNRQQHWRDLTVFGTFIGNPTKYLLEVWNFAAFRTQSVHWEVGNEKTKIML